MPAIHPVFILLVGLVTVIGMIVFLRINAFLALICAALIVSFLGPGPWVEKVARVAVAFGETTGNIGIVIAVAAVIGTCMLESGAADRVVRWFLTLLGEKRADTALLSSGFLLAVPVFFDTVFYLLVPLARSMFKRTGRDYLKYLMVIGVGALITHTMVPPTPGPLVMADNLGVDLGVMIFTGVIVALPATMAGLWYTGWLNKRLDIPMRPIAGQEEPVPVPDHRLPGLALSLAPILLPVLLIGANTAVRTAAPASTAAVWTAVLGNPNLAMLMAGAIALLVYVRWARPTGEVFKSTVERSLASGGLIILITSAGGAFGAMLQTAEIGTAIEGLFAGASAGGMVMLILGFLMAALMKFAQGSGTVAMITASAMMASMVTPETLGLHMVYMATAVGSGSMVGAWMNDSGFWIYAKMGGLTEIEALKSWTVVGAVLGIAGFITTLVLAMVLPHGL